MVTLPSTEELGRRPTPRPQRPDVQISQSAMAAPGRAAEALGRDINQLGNQMLDRWSTAVARERDAAVADQIRDLLYGENGYLSRRGGNAVGNEASLQEQLDRIRGEALNGINNVARERLEPALDRRIDSAMQSVMTHGMGELQRYEEQAAAARITSAYNDALASPSMFDTSLDTLRSETAAEAARLGLPPEAAQVLFSERSDQLFRNEVLRLRATNPEEAWNFLQENRDDMLPGTAIELEEALEPEVMEYRGREAARTGFSHTVRPPVGGNIPVELRYEGTTASSGREVNPYLGRAIQAAVHDVWGEGAVVVFTSGSGRQGTTGFHGGLGAAADFGVIRPDGTWVRDGDPDAPALEVAAARFGIVGFGRGPHYEMGNSIYHMDFGIQSATGRNRGGVTVWSDNPGQPYESDQRGAAGNYAAINEAWIAAGRPRFDPSNPNAIFEGTPYATAGAGGDFGPVGDAAADLIIGYEGFDPNPYWDVNALRIGYGSDTITRADGTVVRVGPGMRVTEEDARRDLDRRINEEFMPSARRAVGPEIFDSLSPSQQSVLTSLAYNYGTGAWSDDLAGVAAAARTGDPEQVAAAIRALQTHDNGINRTRRLREADVYLTGGLGAGEGPERRVMGTSEALDTYIALSHQDPRMADAFLDEWETLFTMAGAEQQEQAIAASQELFNIIERGGSYNDLPVEMRENIPIETRRALQEYERQRRSGQSLTESDPSAYQEAFSMPDALLAQTDIMRYRPRLTDEHWNQLMARHAAARRETTEGTAGPQPRPLSELRTITDTLTTTRDEDGQRVSVFRGRQEAVFEMRLNTWQTRFVETNGRQPTEEEVIQEAGRLTAQVVIDPNQQWFDRDSRAGMLLDFDFRGETPTVDDDVTMADVANAVRDGTFTINGAEVSVADLETAWRMAARRLNPESLDLALTPNNPNLPIQPDTQDVIDALLVIFDRYGG